MGAKTPASPAQPTSVASSTEMPGVKPAIEQPRLHLRAWRWARENPAQTIGLIAGLLAFLRLMAISFGRLQTARALLEHTDLVGLSGGLVVSAGLLWIPPIVAMGAFGSLAGQKDPQMAARIGGGAFTATIFGLIAYADWQDLNARDVPQGGPSLLIFAVMLGAGFGFFLHPILRVSRGRSSGRQQPNASPQVRVEEDPEIHKRQRTGSPTAPRLFARMAQSFNVLLGGLLAVSGLIFMLAMAALSVLILASIMSEPSQPPENLTIVDDGIVVTQTVHVIEDDGDEWLIMRRSDRTLRSIDASAVRDRYTCRIVQIDRHITDEVRQAGFGSTWGRANDQEPAKPSEIAKRTTGEEVDDFARDRARDWIDAVLHAQPPCATEWSSTELAAVRTDLRRECHVLIGCPALSDAGK